MALTVGFVIRDTVADSQEALAKQLARLAERYGYGVDFSIRNSSEEARAGLQILESTWSPAVLALLRAPANLRQAECPALAEALEPGGDRAEFFGFLEEVSATICKRVEDFWVFFCVTWRRGQGVRIRDGGIRDLLAMLRTPESWAIATYDLARDAWWLVDDIPLMFRVCCGED